MKEEHERSCLGRRTKTRVDDYMLLDEETDDNKELKKLKKCQFCDKRFPDVLFQHHLNECKHRQEKCTVCLENVPVKDMQDHRLLKCNFAHLPENKNFNNHNNTYAEAIPEPSKNFERMGNLEEIVEICPSCKCKIPEERYHEHLLLCYNGETRCHFCGIKIPKEKEHSHFRSCPKILEIVEEDNNSQSKLT
ncbi:hypothetical protein AVEN_77951-1 [Araneus ventricosus]|uniref:TRAF-type domain-containing protein n=1 Tax=Araneus ventricosus TaxID=182803 RepID=A0A4Y2DW49_ARAVE|nr:hypothetical protein AVEN_77951-1 [Araneus ventricosus]